MGNSSSSSRSSEEEKEVVVAPQAQPVQQQPSQPVQNTQFSQTTLQSQQVSTSISADDAVSKPFQKFARMKAWVCLLVASIIALTSLLRYIGGGWSSATWVFLVTIISVAISAIALVGYAFRKHEFVGKVWGEGVFSYILFALWIGGLAVAMSPSRQLAVTATDELGLNLVRNANLYFSSWFAFICIFYICGSWTMTCWTKAAEIISAITGRLVKWWGLFIVSLVVLVSSVQFHDSQNCPTGGKTDLSKNACRSNKFAVALGAWASLLTLIAIILAHIGKIHFCVESIFAVILFAFYTAGIAVITYNEGSGIAIGNLYFATWTGFIITIFLCMDCFNEYRKRRAEQKAANPPKKKKSRRHWIGRHSEEEPKKKKSVVQQQPKTVQPAQPTMQSARGLSMRSSLDTDEFCDARDDLDLKL